MPQLYENNNRPGALAAAPAPTSQGQERPSHETVVIEGGNMVCTACGTSGAAPTAAGREPAGEVEDVLTPGGLSILNVHLPVGTKIYTAPAQAKPAAAQGFWTLADVKAAIERAQGFPGWDRLPQPLCASINEAAWLLGKVEAGPAGEVLADERSMRAALQAFVDASDAHDTADDDRDFGQFVTVGMVENARAALATHSGAEVPSDLHEAIENIADELEAEAMNYEGDFADTVQGCAEALRVLLAQHSTKEVPNQPLIGKLMDELSQIPHLFPDGCKEPGALLRHSDVWRVLVDASKSAAAPIQPTREE